MQTKVRTFCYKLWQTKSLVIHYHRNEYTCNSLLLTIVYCYQFVGLLQNFVIEAEIYTVDIARDRDIKAKIYRMQITIEKMGYLKLQKTFPKFSFQAGL